MHEASGDMSGMSGMDHGMEHHDHSAMLSHSAMHSVPETWLVRTLVIVTLAIGGLLVLLARRGVERSGPGVPPVGKDLLRAPVLGRLLRWRHFNTLMVAPTLLIFAYIVGLGLVGEQNTSNPAVLLTWILWWPAVIFTFFLAGRIWCTICPFGAVGDATQKLGSLKRPPARLLKNMWWRLGLFLGLTWLTTMLALDRTPRGTAWLGLALTAGAVALGFIYEKRVFCRYVCPVGGIFGLYSMTAPLRLEVTDAQVCRTDCGAKNCSAACDWFQFPAVMQRGAECSLCLNCVRACPHDNIALRTQPFGNDLVEFQYRRKSLDEATTVAAILGVSLLQTMVMLHAWPEWQARFAALLHVPAGPVLYAIVFLVFGLALPLILLGSITFLTRGQAMGARTALRTYAYAFLPLGLGLHAAHNFHHLFGEGGALWSGLKASLAGSIGWRASSVAVVAPSANLLFLLQWFALVGGLYLACRIIVRLVASDVSGRLQIIRRAAPVAIFATAYTVLNLIVLAAPMAHRH